MFFIYYNCHIIKDIECNNIIILFSYRLGIILTYSNFHISLNRIEFISYFKFRNIISFINVYEKAHLEVFILPILDHFITCLVLKEFTSLLVYYSHEYQLFSYIRNVSLSYYSQFLFMYPVTRSYIELYFSKNYQNLVSYIVHYKILYVSIEIYINCHISTNKYRRQ